MTAEIEATSPVCGLISPISEIDGCPASHWLEVQGIVGEAVQRAGFRWHVVSDRGTSSVIQKRIVQNLYDNDLIICDVSGRNPNVMLELGMRLAFDKPTIVIKDNKTEYTFDISPIEHMTYPRDLRFGSIIDFKNKLAEKARSVLAESGKPDSGSYLKSFGSFEVARIETQEVSGARLLVDELREMRGILDVLMKGMFGIDSNKTSKTTSKDGKSDTLESLEKEMAKLLGRPSPSGS